MDADLAAIETAWQIRLPPYFNLLNSNEWDAVTLPSGDVFVIRGELLTARNIVAARETAEDWDLPIGLLPIIGDFHDLICLDYRSGPEPKVVAMNDARQVQSLFPDFAAFLAARFLRQDPQNRDTSGIIERESWLDF
ncbi:MAG: SMI1/KNR4 family protein [Pirellulaceae bacterium]